jgi:two-component system chemotaxis response regulator CheY
MGYRILVVDDSPVLRIMLSEMLTAMGHEVVGDADNGADAVAKYKELKPDLVTLDVSLPDINGLEVLRKIKRSDPSAQAMMVTGNDQKAIDKEAAALKALAVLRKPFDESELRALIEKLASRIKKR